METTIKLNVTLNRETREVEFTLFGDATRGYSKQVAYCQRNGKAWPCALRAYRQADGTYKISYSEVRLNRQYPIVGWLDKTQDSHRSQHNGR